MRWTPFSKVHVCRRAENACLQARVEQKNAIDQLKNSQSNEYLLAYIRRREFSNILLHSKYTGNF